MEAAYEPPEHALPSSSLSVLPVLIQNQPYLSHLHSSPPFAFIGQIFKGRAYTHFIEFFKAPAFRLPDTSSWGLVRRVHSWWHHEEYSRLSLSLGLALRERGVYSWENVVYQMHRSSRLLYKGIWSPLDWGNRCTDNTTLNFKSFLKDGFSREARRKIYLTTSFREVCRSLLTSSESIRVPWMTAGLEDGPGRSNTSSEASKQNVRITIRDCRGIKLPATIEQSSASCNARGTVPELLLHFCCTTTLGSRHTATDSSSNVGQCGSHRIRQESLRIHSTLP